MKLCINCDDFGFSREVNRGAFEAIDHGLITSCSVMARQATGRDLKRLADSAISIGLHVTLTGPGKGTLASSPLELMMKLLLGRIAIQDLRREIRHQFDRLGDLAATPISHLDSHQHIHLIPVIRQIFKEIAEENNILYIRNPTEISRSWSPKKIFLNCCFARSTAGPCFWGTGLMGKNFTVEKILGQLDYLQQLNIPEAIWMVHPGYETSSTQIDSYNSQRRRELEVLKQLAGELRSRCILVPLTDLGHQHAQPAKGSIHHEVKI